MTEKENLKNMEQCPKFESCEIPKCPLDLWADERTQLSEDKRCPNWKYAGIGVRRNMKEGHIMPSLRDKVRVIGEYRKMSEKTAPNL